MAQVQVLTPTPMDHDILHHGSADTQSMGNILRFSSGLILPPPEIKAVIDKTAAFVANSQNPPLFEDKIRENQRSDPKFSSEIREGLHQPTAEELESLEEKRKKEEEEKLSPQAQAAKLGMYGPMTREVKTWQPARLLCKRFGLKEPEISPDELDPSLTSKKGPSFTTSEAEEAFRQAAGNSGAASSSQHPAQPDAAGVTDLANVGLGEDENQGKDTLTYQRPAMDIFKAIFASDDEDSDEEEPDDEPPTESKKEEATVVVTVPSHSMLDDKPVDLATFRPTFIPRDGKGKKTNDEDRSKLKKEKKREKKEKRKKEKKGPLVSFEVDDEPSLDVFRERPKRRKRDKVDDHDDSMWVEKPASNIVKTLPPVPLEGKVVDLKSTPSLTSSETAESGLGGSESVARKGRKRAVDFL